MSRSHQHGEDAVLTVFLSPLVELFSRLLSTWRVIDIDSVDDRKTVVQRLNPAAAKRPGTTPPALHLVMETESEKT